MVDRLDCLRHDAVVRSDDQHNDIRNGRAARAHGGKRFVSGRIEEGNRLASDRDGICADMLRNAARFALGDIRAPDLVEKRRLAVVDVPHHRNHRRTGHIIFIACGFCLINFAERFLGGLFRFILQFDPQIGGDIGGGIVIERIVDRLCDPLFEQPLCDLDGRDAKFFAEYLQRDVFRRHDGMFDLDRLHRLLFLLFDAQFSVSALVLVEIGNGDLLFYKGALGYRLFLFDIGLIV